jgi:hypothetical protein
MEISKTKERPIIQAPKKDLMDVDSTTSKRTGFLGVLESFLRRFRTLAFTAILAPIALIYIFCIGVSLTPGITIFNAVEVAMQGMYPLVRNVCLGFSLAAGFCSYGLTLIFVVPLVNKLLPLKVKPHRATWFSLTVVPWYYHNALTYLARYTFLDFITPSPLNKLFYQMMGMKVGKGTIINTSNISDPCLIEIGDYVTIGGSATLVGHYGMKGILIMDKLIIGDKAVIGMKATVFGDVVIGKGALVKPSEVVLPKTRIPDRDEKEAAQISAAS